LGRGLWAVREEASVVEFKFYSKRMMDQ
jgi:hypothetical protein